MLHAPVPVPISPSNRPQTHNYFLAWTAKYPDPNNNAFPPSNMPQAWVDALNAAVAAGKIPNVPVSTMGSLNFYLLAMF